MAGIADVQPKSIGQVNITPVSPAVLPGPAGSGVSETLPEAFQKYSQMFNTIKDKPLIELQRENAMQQAQLTQQMAPDIAAAQQSAAQLAAAQSAQQRATLNTGDLEKLHYQVYGAPINGKDGKTPDHQAMAQSGLAVQQAQYRYARAMAGVQMIPYKKFVNGVEITRYRNGLGQDVTDNPDGSPNKLILLHQQNAENAFEQLHSPPQIHSDTPGSVQETPPVGEPADDENGAAAAADAIVSPISSGIPLVTPPVVQSVNLPTTVPSITPVNPQVAQEQANIEALRNKFFGPGPSSTPFDAQGAVNSYLQGQQQPVVLPAAPAAPAAVAPVTTTTHTTDPQGKPVVTVQSTPAAPVAPPVVAPAYPTGDITGYAPHFSPAEIAEDMRKSPMYSEWAPLAAPIGAFRSAVKSYANLPKGSPTVGSDLELANAIIRMQNKSGSSKGSPEYKVDRLEDAAPILERIPELAGTVLRTKAYPEGTRKRLIAAGNRIAESVEAPARSAVDLAARRLSAQPTDPRTVLSDYELSLLKGGSSGAGASSGGGVYGPPVKTLDGRTVRMKLPVAGGQ
jgi:hypothetical protein